MRSVTDHVAAVERCRPSAVVSLAMRRARLRQCRPVRSRTWHLRGFDRRDEVVLPVPRYRRPRAARIVTVGESQRIVEESCGSVRIVACAETCRSLVALQVPSAPARFRPLRHGCTATHAARLLARDVRDGRHFLSTALAPHRQTASRRSFPHSTTTCKRRPRGARNFTWHVGCAGYSERSGLPDRVLAWPGQVDTGPESADLARPGGCVSAKIRAGSRLHLRPDLQQLAGTNHRSQSTISPSSFALRTILRGIVPCGKRRHAIVLVAVETFVFGIADHADQPLARAISGQIGGTAQTRLRRENGDN